MPHPARTCSPVVTLMPSSTTTSFNAPPPAGPIEVAAPGAAVGPNQAHLAAVAQSRSMRAVGSKRASLVQVRSGYRGAMCSVRALD